MAKWQRMWDGQDNQEVGLEAAILERKRNSSLVKLLCAENVTGLKHSAEAAEYSRSPETAPGSNLGGASGVLAGLVGEHSQCRGRVTVRRPGGVRRAYADTSSEKRGENPRRPRYQRRGDGEGQVSRVVDIPVAARRRKRLANPLLQ